MFERDGPARGKEHINGKSGGERNKNCLLYTSIGNPMYHWTNLELHVCFGYEGVLNGDTAEEVWNLCNDKLQHLSLIHI